MNSITEELVKYKHAELCSLGIVPKLYYHACKLLKRHITTVIKDGILYQFINESNPELVTDKKQLEQNRWVGGGSDVDKRYSVKEAIELIEQTFGLNNQESTNIVNEWRRGVMVSDGMYKKVSKYWRYISLPETLDEESNF